MRHGLQALISRGLEGAGWRHPCVVCGSAQCGTEGVEQGFHYRWGQGLENLVARFLHTEITTREPSVCLMLLFQEHRPEEDCMKGWDSKFSRFEDAQRERKEL